MLVASMIKIATKGKDHEVTLKVQYETLKELKE